jgi:hypothetical protein
MVREFDLAHIAAGPADLCLLRLEDRVVALVDRFEAFDSATRPC